jgi:hypothetical protein
MSGFHYVQGRAGNVQSYQAFETLFWATFHREINIWRYRFVYCDLFLFGVVFRIYRSLFLPLINHSTLKLPTIYGYANSTNLVLMAKLPFSAMWSPSFVPKPDDWPEQAEVVGTFVIDQKKNFDPAPFSDLMMWLENGPKPVFIGFGSMVIKEPEKLSTIIKKAAVNANVRCVVQSGWTKLDVEDDENGMCHNVGPCPHDWLLPLCCGVVHHGGAGTTAAGLRFGLPTFICPFFADQFMWGYFVELAGVGPKACPVTKLTAEILTVSLAALSSENLRIAAKAMATDMNLEDGIDGGKEHFIGSLRRENMLCDVSVILGECNKARYELVGSGLKQNGIKVGSEVAALLEAENNIDWYSIWNWFPTWNKMDDRYWYVSCCTPTIAKARLLTAIKLMTGIRALDGMQLRPIIWQVTSVRSRYDVVRTLYLIASFLFFVSCSSMLLSLWFL